MLYRGQSAIDHPKQGMLAEHMKHFAEVARRRGELIMVRPVSPWAKKMIEDGCPTKGFAVKAKSSNWGPQCGLIPADPAHPYLSKVGKGPKQADNVKFIRQAVMRRYVAGKLADESHGTLIRYENTTDVFTVDPGLHRVTRIPGARIEAAARGDDREAPALLRLLSLAALRARL